MALNIKEKIDEIVKKLTSDKALMAKFEKNPISAIEGLVGVDLPDEQLSKLVDGIKAKLKLDKAGDLLGGIFGKK